jgi:hypothetical protein
MCRWRVAGPLSRGWSCGCLIPRGFRGVGGFDFSGKEVKTPTLPKAGRVGHPKNLNQVLRVHALQRKGWPPAGWFVLHIDIEVGAFGGNQTVSIS